jgi:hypothetical protein
MARQKEKKEDFWLLETLLYRESAVIPGILKQRRARLYP